MNLKDRLTMDSSVVENGYTLKDLCTFGRDGEPTDELGCEENCENCDFNCYECPIQEAFNRLAEYENTGLSPDEIRKHDDFPELKRYNEENILDLDRPSDSISIKELACYEIIFEVNTKRFYCYVNAVSLNEALGLFFRYHPHITYEMVVDHVEV